MLVARRCTFHALSDYVQFLCACTAMYYAFFIVILLLCCAVLYGCTSYDGLWLWWNVINYLTDLTLHLLIQTAMFGTF